MSINTVTSFHLFKNTFCSFSQSGIMCSEGYKVFKFDSQSFDKLEHKYDGIYNVKNPNNPNNPNTIVLVIDNKGTQLKLVNGKTMPHEAIATLSMESAKKLFGDSLPKDAQPPSLLFKANQGIVKKLYELTSFFAQKLFNQKSISEQNLDKCLSHAERNHANASYLLDVDFYMRLDDKDKPIFKIISSDTFSKKQELSDGIYQVNQTDQKNCHYYLVSDNKKISLEVGKNQQFTNYHVEMIRIMYKISVIKSCQEDLKKIEFRFRTYLDANAESCIRLARIRKLNQRQIEQLHCEFNVYKDIDKLNYCNSDSNLLNDVKAKIKQFDDCQTEAKVVFFISALDLYNSTKSYDSPASHHLVSAATCAVKVAELITDPAEKIKYLNVAAKLYGELADQTTDTAAKIKYLDEAAENFMKATELLAKDTDAIDKAAENPIKAAELTKVNNAKIEYLNGAVGLYKKLAESATDPAVKIKYLDKATENSMKAAELLPQDTDAKIKYLDDIRTYSLEVIGLATDNHDKIKFLVTVAKRFLRVAEFTNDNKDTVMCLFYAAESYRQAFRLVSHMSSKTDLSNSAAKCYNHALSYTLDLNPVECENVKGMISKGLDEVQSYVLIV